LEERILPGTFPRSILPSNQAIKFFFQLKSSIEKKSRYLQPALPSLAND
jgi:hypothetical protein